MLALGKLPSGDEDQEFSYQYPHDNPNRLPLMVSEGGYSGFSRRDRTYRSTVLTENFDYRHLRNCIHHIRAISERIRPSSNQSH